MGDEFAVAAVARQPKPDPLDPVAVAAAAPPPEQELTSIVPAPEVPAARAASGESHRFRLVIFLQIPERILGRRTAGHHVRLLFVLAQPAAQANKA